MKVSLKKFRVSLPLKRGKTVAAETFEQAAQACLPDYSLSEKRTGPRWVMFETEEELPEQWPDEEEGDGGGNLVDVEFVGDILVVIPSDD